MGDSWGYWVFYGGVKMKCDVCEFETNDEVGIEQFHHSEDIDYCESCYEGMIV